MKHSYILTSGEYDSYRVDLLLLSGNPITQEQIDSLCADYLVHTYPELFPLLNVLNHKHVFNLFGLKGEEEEVFTNYVETVLNKSIFSYYADYYGFYEWLAKQELEDITVAKFTELYEGVLNV